MYWPPLWYQRKFDLHSSHVLHWFKSPGQSSISFEHSSLQPRQSFKAFPITWQVIVTFSEIVSYIAFLNELLKYCINNTVLCHVRNTLLKKIWPIYRGGLYHIVYMKIYKSQENNAKQKVLHASWNSPPLYLDKRDYIIWCLPIPVVSLPSAHEGFFFKLSFWGFW